MNTLNRSLYLLGNYFNFVEFLVLDSVLNGCRSLSLYLDISNYSFRLIYAGNQSIDENLLDLIRQLSSVELSDSNNVLVSQIFYSFPLRRKLINFSYEFNRIVEILQHISIYSHSLDIKLHSDSSKLTLPPSFDTLSAFNQVHSTNIHQVHELSHHSHQLSIEGFIALDRHFTSAYQHLYINHHHLDRQHSISISLNNALNKAITEKNKHTIFVIKIHLPLSKLDCFNNTLHIDNDKHVISILNQIIQDFITKYGYNDSSRHLHSLSNAARKSTRKTIKRNSVSSNQQSKWLEGILGVSVMLPYKHSTNSR